MGISQHCWYGTHWRCKYFGCICDCHDKSSQMAKLLEQVHKLNHKQRQKHPNFNPHPPK